MAKDDFEDLASGPKGKVTRDKPMTDEERIIVQNLFDTQPARRKAFMKQIGLELDPKDDNKYRPLGSNQPFHAEIDPGITAYFKPGGLKEVAMDLMDVGYDFGVQAPLVGAGATLGAGAGSAAGGMAGLAAAPATAGASLPAGLLAGFGLGSFLGGAAGNAAAEMVKKEAGDLVLDEKIGPNYKAMALQSFVVGALPKVFQSGRQAASSANRVLLEGQRKVIVNAASQSGGGLTPELLERAAKNPEMFTDEAVQGATARLKGTYKEIFGLDSPTQLKSTRQVKEGMFRKVLDPLNEAATEEIERLAKDPRANWKFAEIADPIKKQIRLLSDKFERTSDEDAALGYLRGKLQSLESKVGPSKRKTGEIRYGRPVMEEAPGREINFKEGREFLKAIQDDAFNKEIPGAGFLKQVAGGSPDALRAVADQKAGALGSNLPKINAERNKILKTYNAIQESLTPTSIQTAFIGGDTVRKGMIRDAVGEMDRTLGTQYGPQIETGAMQRVIEQMYQNPKAFGSGRVIPEAIAGAAKGGLAGAGAGAGAGIITGVGAVPGATVGGLAGAAIGAQRATALASPQRALGALGKNLERTAATEQTLANPHAPLGPIGEFGAVETGNIIADKVVPANPKLLNEAKASDDPFADLTHSGN